MVKKNIVLAFGILMVAFGACIVLKCAIGVGAWDAFSQTGSSITGIKVGTFSMLMNISCVIAQVILAKKIKVVLIMQLLLSVLLGALVNFFYYQLLGNWNSGTYLMTLVFFLIGNLSCIFGVGMVTGQDYVCFPLEGLCLIVADKLGRSFGKIRQLADVITIIGALVLVVLFKGMMTIREGTIITMLMFGPMLDLFMKYIKPFMVKIHVF